MPAGLLMLPLQNFVSPFLHICSTVCVAGRDVPARRLVNEYLPGTDIIHMSTSDRTLVDSPKTPAKQVTRRPEVSLALLPAKRPFQSQDEPESTERPRKKARTVDPEATLDDLGISVISRVKFAKEPPVAPAAQKKGVPLIDLSQVQCKGRKSSELNITLVKDFKSTLSSQKQWSVSILIRPSVAMYSDAVVSTTGLPS